MRKSKQRGGALRLLDTNPQEHKMNRMEEESASSDETESERSPKRRGYGRQNSPEEEKFSQMLNTQMNSKRP